MLQAKISKTLNMLDQYADLEQKKQQVNRVKAVHTPLTNKSIDVNNAVGSYKTLMLSRPGDITPFINAQILIKFRTNLKGETFPSITDITAFSTTLDQWGNNLKKDWIDAIDDASSDVLDTLKAILPFVEDTTSITQLRTKINQLRTAWPVNEGCIKKLNDTIEEAQKVIGSLGASPDVQVFIKKVSAGKATVLDLNQDVLDWVKAKNLDTKLKISF